MRVLVVEDERTLAEVIARGLQEEGLSTTVVGTGEAALAQTTHSDWDAIVLDLGLPGIDGLEVCRRLRRAGTRTPVLMLTARDPVADRITGLDSGADDYLVKPFSFGELVARLRALDRRARDRPGDDRLAVGDLRLDPQARRAWRGEQELELTPREFALLEAFMRRPGRLLTRAHLLDHAWDHSFEARSNTVDVHVRSLRDKIDRPFGTESIQTVWGQGYRLRTEEPGP
jgi:two-component system OmpR family response regulator